MNKKRQLDEIEQLVRAGEIARAQKSLESIPKNTLDGSMLVDFASLCRRAEMPELGLSVFSGAGDFDDEELVELSFCLLEIGASDEARERLNCIRGPKSGNAYQCGIHLAFNDWDFAEVIELAEDFFGRHGNEDYTGVTISVNLAAALVETKDYDRAEEILQRAITSCSLNDWQRVRANCHEILGQLEIQRENWSLATAHLEKSQEILEGQNSIDTLFIETSYAVLQCRREEKTDALYKFRDKIRGTHRLELLRAIDFEILKVRFDKELYNKLYFGSPFANYRKLLEQEWGRPAETLLINDSAKEILELSQGTISGKKYLSPGTKTHATIAILLQDFYRPTRVGTLFRYLFPGEFINGESSFHRVHQVLYRTRDLIREKNLAMQIDSLEGIFRLTVEPELGIRLHLNNLIDRWESMLYRIKDHFGEKPFTASQAMAALELSHPTLSRFFKHAEEHAWIQKRRSGHEFIYQLSEDQ